MSSTDPRRRFSAAKASGCLSVALKIAHNSSSSFGYNPAFTNLGLGPLLRQKIFFKTAIQAESGIDLPFSSGVRSSTSVSAGICVNLVMSKFKIGFAKSLV